MKKPKVYKYLIDRLSSANSDKLRSALESIEAIKGVRVSPSTGLIEVQAHRNVEEEVEIACRVVGLSIRTEIKKKGLFG